MMSSSELSGIEAKAKEAGVDKFITKPIFPSTFIDVINECLGAGPENPGEAENDVTGIFAGHCILLAEDVEINRDIVMALLEKTCLEIDCAQDGAEAVRVFEAAPEKYEMIFMDLQMPEMDGLTAARCIRDMGIVEAKCVPIVAIMANDFQDDADTCLAAGINDRLGKPLDIKLVMNTLKRYLAG
jgi:CheY-like chemotaxis protein